MIKKTHSNVTDNTFDVIVVGGGPSGMMASGFSARRGLRVLLIEKNEHLGDKLKATGGGRCNITNAEEDRETFIRHYGSAKDFLYSAFAKFGVKDTFNFFEERGLPLVIEARKRVFPVSQKAEDVFRVLEKFMKKNGVIVKTNQKTSKILTNENKIVGVMAGKEKYYCNSLILATGGFSHPELGATGDGFTWLKSLGHKVKEASPDIVPFSVREKWVKDLSGVTLSFMKITFFLDGVKKFSKMGKILFTHFGLSGPLILNSSRQVKDLLKAGVVTATIDTYPHTDLGALEKEIVKTFNKNKNKTLKNVLPEITPHGLFPALELLLPKLDLDLGKKVHSIEKEERKKIVDLLKAMPLTVSGLMGFDRAVVSDGGVMLNEIDTRTMRSRIHPNLFITGDLLNINRPSGGFSLQLCWTTGYVAGMNV
ncbi:MAG: NAD(P)/FAD-dependent oxidoreductase [Candidatus Paceibacterota bacterium]